MVVCSVQRALFTFRKFSEKFFRLLPVGTVSKFWAGKASDMNFLPIMSNLRVPRAVSVFVNPFEPGGVSFFFSSVPGVLGLRGFAQIGNSIVRLVAVNVVKYVSGFSTSGHFPNYSVNGDNFIVEGNAAIASLAAHKTNDWLASPFSLSPRKSSGFSVTNKRIDQDFQRW